MKLHRQAIALGVALAVQQGYAQQTELETTVIDAEEAENISADQIDTLDIDRTGMSNITDLVRHNAGVQVNDTGDRYNDNGYNIRGVEGDDIAVTVDGLSQGETLSPPSFAAYGLFGSNRNTTDVELVKSIEITKGPASVLNGSGALGGAVTMTTRDVDDYVPEGSEKNSSVDLKAGYDARSSETLMRAAFANRIGGFETLLSYVARRGSETESFFTSGDPGVGPTRRFADPFDTDKDSVLAKVAYNFNPQHKLGLVYEASDEDSTGNILSRDSISLFDWFTDDTQEKDRFGLFYEFSDAQNAIFDELSVTADWQELNNQGISNFTANGSDVTISDDDFLRQEDRSTTEDTVRFSVDFEKTLGGRDQHSLVYGLSYSDNSIENVRFDNRFATPDPDSEQTQNLRDPDWVPVTDKRVFNIYVSDEYALTDSWIIDAGIRFDTTSYSPMVDENFTDSTGLAVSDADFSDFAGQLGVTYRFNDQHSVNLLFARSYRAPTTQELFLDAEVLDDGLVDLVTGATFDDFDVISNPNLGAETALSLELSYTWETERSFATLNLFQTDYRDGIQRVTESRDLGQTIELPGCTGRSCTGDEPNMVTSVDQFDQAANVGETFVRGIEIESAFAITQDLVLSFSSSITEGEFETPFTSEATSINSHEVGDDLVTLAPNSATLGLAYNSRSGRWGAQADMVWTDAKGPAGFDPCSNEAFDVDQSICSLNNGNGIAAFSNTSTVIDLSFFYNVTDNLSLNANVFNLTDKEYLRWEVINNVRPLDASNFDMRPFNGFFGGVVEEGVGRFTEPGRSFSLTASYAIDF